MATRRRFNQATAPQPEQRFPRAQRPSANLFPLASSNIKRGGRNGGLPSNPQPAPMPAPPAGWPPINPPIPYAGPQPSIPQEETPMGPFEGRGNPYRPPTPQLPSWEDQNPRIPGYQGERGGGGMSGDEVYDAYLKLPPRAQQEFLREHPAFAWKLRNGTFNAYPHGPRDPGGPQPVPQPYPHGTRPPGGQGTIPYVGPQPSIPPSADPAPGLPPRGEPAPMPVPPGGPVGPQPEIPHGNEPAPPGVGRIPEYQTGGNAYDYFMSLGGGVDALLKVLPGAQLGGVMPPGATVVANGPDGTPIWMAGGAWNDLTPDLKALAGNVSAGGQLAGVYNPTASGFGGYDPSSRGDLQQTQTSVPPQTPVPVQSGGPQPLSQASTAGPATAQAQSPAPVQSPGASAFPDMSWGGSGGAGGKGGLPISPQFEAGRRFLEDQLSQELAAIGVAEAEIPVTLKLIQARLKADEEESMRQIRESTNARGTFASGGTLRDFDLSGRGYERSRRDAQMEAARARGELARRRQGAHSDYLKGLSDLILGAQPGSEGERTNPDEEPGKKQPPKSNRNRSRNRNRKPRKHRSASGAFGTKKAGK